MGIPETATVFRPALRPAALADHRLMARLPARLRVSHKIPFVWTDGRRMGLRMPVVKQSIRRWFVFNGGWCRAFFVKKPPGDQRRQEGNHAADHVG